MADQRRTNRVAVVAYKNAKIVVAMILKERLVVVAEPFVDELTVLSSRVLFNAEPAAGRKVHRDVLQAGETGRMLSLRADLVIPRAEHGSKKRARGRPARMSNRLWPPPM